MSKKEEKKEIKLIDLTNESGGTTKISIDTFSIETYIPKEMSGFSDTVVLQSDLFTLPKKWSLYFRIKTSAASDGILFGIGADPSTLTINNAIYFASTWSGNRLRLYRGADTDDDIYGSIVNTYTYGKLSCDGTILTYSAGEDKTYSRGTLTKDLIATLPEQVRFTTATSASAWGTVYQSMTVYLPETYIINDETGEYIWKAYNPEE